MIYADQCARHYVTQPPTNNLYHIMAFSSTPRKLEPGKFTVIIELARDCPGKFSSAAPIERLYNINSNKAAQEFSNSHLYHASND